MSSDSFDPVAFVSIAAVERDTGIGKDTLRVWERRYGFPQPERDGHGERLYPLVQVEQLRHIRRLMDAGYRPGKIVGLSMSQLVELAQLQGPTAVARQPAVDADADLMGLLAAVRAHDAMALRKRCAQEVLQRGLGRFILQVAVPLCQAVGEAWARGELAVFEEHLCSESLETVLRASMSGLSDGAVLGAPKVLLATLPSELHGLGLLMAQALFLMQGCTCLSLGTQLPVPELVQAARAQGSDVVVLSFSAAHPAQQVLDGMEAVRSLLPAACEVWAGCTHPAVKRRGVPGVQVFDRLVAIAPAVQHWRAQHLPA